MEATNIQYDLERSLKRIDDILNESDKSFEERNSIPSRSELTFTNGFYVDCTALFVDIIDSSSLPEKQNRPVLAKIYRSFISEMVALMNGHDTCREVCINGDCVWCVCNTPQKADVDGVFDLAAKACSLVDILNYKLSKKGYQTYKVGVGIDDGRALMVKAGHSGSSINDVVWMGDVVNQACHLCAEANSPGNKRVFLSNVIYNNLKDDYKKLCTKDSRRDIYQADVFNIGMNNWLKEQK
ncbi:adenylate/guanylate cyclase domain-containing protein [Xylanibacter ruminicola]|uniref:Adenylate and Guanylate cyclase catalytic domain-containing protein n=1 Tax=Xylanibacter ruminicola TaxID=839 RepID=A0A1M6R1F5_XYLRU|nr:adenylate/guanylate cyclase domain-containing protein [Xylanibacter ruminicola]SHK26321.1 Adenylate and Guanylate cyclase catalytic domain-containing protein [Xylanibacter ruminicola]